MLVNQKLLNLIYSDTILLSLFPYLSIIGYIPRL
nr:MAG TPA: hypothetical protein [Caudoviricetes sp.]DAR07827.1 MAG TPA: hypothetical protein [Caudoviricetes sp.]